MIFFNQCVFTVRSLPKETKTNPLEFEAIKTNWGSTFQNMWKLST